MSDIKELIASKLRPVANAIRYKKGTTDLIKAENFAEEIKNMSSGENDEILFSLLDSSKYYRIPLVVPYGVVKLRNSAFYGFSVLPDGDGKKIIILPETVTEIGQNTFCNSNFTNIIIPESVKTFNTSCFDGMQDLEEIVMPKEVTNIGTSIFKNCRKLEKVTLPENLTQLTDYMFSGCSQLLNLEISESVTQIGVASMDGCKKLTYLEIPESVTKIGTNSFGIGTSTNKATIVMKSSVPPTLSGQYTTSGLNKIFVPLGTRETYISATNWSLLADYIVEPNDVIVNVPETLLNDENYQYSLDNGQTWLNFDNSVLNLTSVFTIKFKSESASPTILIGTTDGGSDIGTIANAELMHVISGNETIYLTIQA